jgi:hypothetical protein
MTSLERAVRQYVKARLSPASLTRLRVLTRGLGSPRWGNLRRLRPFSEHFGFDRGTPIDRYYLHRFLQANAADIRGDVLEIQMPGYTRRFGRDLRRCDSIDIDSTHAPTYCCDLAAADMVPSGEYDCFLAPNTINLLRDIRGSLRHMLRVVKPGGVVLATGAVLGPLMADAADYWHLSADGWRELVHEAWAGHEYDVQPHGNCLTATAALLGLAHEELTADELEYQDPRYPVLVTLRCRRI